MSLDDPDLIAAKAATFQAEGDLSSAATLLAQLPQLSADSNASTAQKYQWLYERRFQEVIEKCKAELAKPGDLDDSTRGLVLFLLGLAETRAGDTEAAQAVFAEGRRFLEELTKDGESGDPYAVAYLALVCAAAGDKDAALKTGARAVQLTERDGFLRPLMELALVQVRALLGDADGTVDGLQKLMTMAGTSVTPALLRLDPVWDSIAPDPRFQRLATSGR